MELKINLYHHLDVANVGIVKEILDLLHDIRRSQKEAAVAIARDFEVLRKAMDDATNVVAGRIDRLSAGIKNSMTDDEVAALKAGFQAEVNRLNTLGQDPVDPVPPAPAAPPLPPV